MFTFLGTLRCYFHEQNRKTCPIKIPKNARIFKKIKQKGYTQVEFRWSEGGFRYFIRAHTEIPNSPGFGNVWVVYREIISDGTFRSYKEFLSGDDWIKGEKWFTAIDNQKLGKISKEELKISENGHFKAE